MTRRSLGVGPAVRTGSSPEPEVPPTVDALLHAAVSGLLGPDPAQLRVGTCFVTRQGVRHHGRLTGYRNDVVSLRVGAAVGSCALEPGEVPDDTVLGCAGQDVAALLAHPARAIRVATLDAYLMHLRPHAGHADDTVRIPSGDSLDKSRTRASAVVDLLPATPPARVLVVGVVNSLLAELRERGFRYVPCDLRSGVTEWGEAHERDATGHLDACDALLASGMTLGNGTFEPLAAHARATGKPFVLFAQTASAVAPFFLGHGVTAVSAEPYPFFWLDGGPTAIHRYRTPVRPRGARPAPQTTPIVREETW
ncbi:Rossmann-like domain-containing protein [Streptodolium elevatio]